MDRRRDRVSYYAIVVGAVNLFGNRREFSRDEVKIIERHGVFAEGCESVNYAEKRNRERKEIIRIFRRSALHACTGRHFRNVSYRQPVSLDVSLESYGYGTR
jgi:hypothetical protein